ncbi:MAG: homoserine dehydrogenase [Alphaproteobacteria bacterium]|nr:homoserine dehydrogenase [Alphaproteobacteria bacterium]
MTGTFRIALAGLGHVGGGVAQILLTRGQELAQRAGRKLQLVAVCARDRAKPRRTDISHLPWIEEPVSLAQTNADLVVEVIGGQGQPALGLIEASLQAQKAVVTANKALLAYHGARLAALAEKEGVPLRFEAAAAGGIPIVKGLRQSLITYGIDAIRGILNGTCNYILTQMEATGRSFAEVLAEAQARGFAEADPELDVGGGDTAHKLALLSALAFGVPPDMEAIRIQGIRHISRADIAFAKEFSYRIKLLGIARKTPSGLDQRVQPALVRLGTPLADVDSVFNAVVAHAGAAGPFTFEGRGAGEEPTTSAVISDIVDIARGESGPAFGRPAKDLHSLPAAPPEAHPCPHYLRFDVRDLPGVLAEIAGHLARENVSIESMIQRGRRPGEPVAIVMVTHHCPETNVMRALEAINASDMVLGPPCMIPIEAS